MRFKEDKSLSDFCIPRTYLTYKYSQVQDFPLASLTSTAPCPEHIFLI